MISLLDQRIHFIPLKTRMPFRYGIATMTDLPIAFVFLKFQFGESAIDYAWGVSSDLLPPRWFKKDPEQLPLDEIEEMKAVLMHAVSIAETLSAVTPFDFWHQLSQQQLAWAKKNSIPELLANFGCTFVERAMLDAFARFSKETLSNLLKSDKLGLDLGKLHPELIGKTARELLPQTPLAEVNARHTIGFGDPLRENEITCGIRVDDTLPQSLEAAIELYGLSQFKVKIKGEREEDLERLEALATIFQKRCDESYSLSLDGNEQFISWKQFSQFWEVAQTRPKLQSLLKRILFIEQPLSRETALEEIGIGQLQDGSSTPPVIIDESDAGPTCFRQALDCGYRGVSHKNCKGVFKGIANRCLIEFRNQTLDTQLFMSGEDLCNLGPVALLQDLTIQSILGNSSVERNGHHYFYGLSQFPTDTQDLILERHPELYQRGEDSTASLRIENGMIRTETLTRANFGTRFTVEELYSSLIEGGSLE